MRDVFWTVQVQQAGRVHLIQKNPNPSPKTQVEPMNAASTCYLTLSRKGDLQQEGNQFKMSIKLLK